MAPPASSIAPRLRRGRSRAGAGAVRTVEVVPPSQGDELIWLANAAGAVVLILIYVFAFETFVPPGSGAGAAPSLLPYQVLFRDLPGNEQRAFRAMQEGVAEALRLRAESGGWPSVETLADAGVPPFARDVLDKTGLAWSLRHDGLVVNYVGIPAAPDTAPSFLILVQEPDPVTGEKAPPPSVVDEEHRLLPDGTLLHVTYWTGAVPRLRAGVLGDPALAGLQQIRVTSPAEEMGAWRDRLFRDG